MLALSMSGLSPFITRTILPPLIQQRSYLGLRSLSHDHQQLRRVLENRVIPKSIAKRKDLSLRAKFVAGILWTKKNSDFETLPNETMFMLILVHLKARINELEERMR